MLSDKDCRQLALKLKTSGGLLVSQLAKQLEGKSATDINSIQTRLLTVEVIASEIVVICKKTSAQIVKVATAKALADLANQQLNCASCGRAIKDETQEEALTTTDLGQYLLDGSRWFSLLLQSELMDLGVSPTDILMEEQEGGDEMDCLVNLGGHFALLELKDKEFSLRNAYSFGAKMTLYEPEYPVIATTDFVGSDVKDHFERASTRSVRHKYRVEEGTGPVRYVEGLEQLRPQLAGLIGEINRHHASRILSQIGAFGSFNPGPLLAALEGTPPPENDPPAGFDAARDAGQ